MRWATCVAVVLVLSAQGPGSARGSLQGELYAWLDTLYPAGEPGAAVFVRRGDTTLVRKGYGVASLELGAPITSATAFRLASISKQFTAVAVLRLAQEGRVDLGASVSTYLPELSESATIEQLLSHTSGLGSFDNLPDFASWSRVPQEPRGIIARLEARPRSFAPGTDWAYSDAGYFLLGAVIERVTGRSYDTYLRERVFLPAGMAASTVDDDVRVIEGKAEGYARVDGHFQRASSRHMSSAFSAGAVVSTVDDLARWDDALSDGRVVSPTLLSRAFTAGRLPDGRTTSYGFGWLVSRRGEDTVLEHGGRLEGYTSHVIRVPSRRIFIAVLTNATGREPSPDFVATRILRRLLGDEADEIPIEPRIARQYVGRYRLPSGVDCDVAFEGGRIVMRRSGRDRQLVALGTDRFRFTTSYSELRFGRDVAGVVDRISISPAYGPAFEARRVR